MQKRPLEEEVLPFDGALEPPSLVENAVGRANTLGRTFRLDPSALFSS